MIRNFIFHFSMNTKYADENSKPAPARQYIILSQKPIIYIAEPCYFSSFFTVFKIFWCHCFIKNILYICKVTVLEWY